MSKSMFTTVRVEFYNVNWPGNILFIRDGGKKRYYAMTAERLLRLQAIFNAHKECISVDLYNSAVEFTQYRPEKAKPFIYIDEDNFPASSDE